MRTLLKREESYAIHALINIASKPGTNAKQVAADLDMPPAFMAKVLGKLAKEQLIDSKVGRLGGVRLARNLETLSLLSVIEAISGPIVMDSCQSKVKCEIQESKGHCQLKLAWLQTSRGIREVLNSIPLTSLYEYGDDISRFSVVTREHDNLKP